MRCARFRRCPTSASPATFPAAFNNNEPALLPRGRRISRSTKRGSPTIRSATSGYFAALKIPLLRGRWFDDSDRARWHSRSRSSAPRSRGSYWRRRRSDRQALQAGARRAVDHRGRRRRATSCTTGSVRAGRRRSIVRSARTAPYSVAFALRTVGDPMSLGRRSPARGRARWIPISRSHR